MKTSISIVVGMIALMSGVALAQITPTGLTEELIKWTLSNGTTPLRSYGLLTPDDGSYEPKYPPPGGPGLPDRCSGLEKNVCRDCGFDDALSNLQSTRYRLEKLRRVYASTKQMVNSSLAAGDSMAGAAGLGGVAWVSERMKILKSFKGVQQAYDAKYQELMALLQKALRDIAACEELAFGEENWYERYGFMYYETMAAVYQRTD